MVIVTLPTQGSSFPHSRRLRRLAGISQLAMSKREWADSSYPPFRLLVRTRFWRIGQCVYLRSFRVIQKIISGGQTGADRMALDWAISHEISHGGWCPKGRKAEDGPLGSKYLLKETPTSDYPQRTEWNVRDWDGTVIFSLARALTGGSERRSLLRSNTRSRGFTSVMMDNTTRLAVPARDSEHASRS